MFDARIFLGVIEDLLGINPHRGILNLKLRTLKATKLRVFKFRLKLLTLNHFLANLRKQQVKAPPRCASPEQEAGRGPAIRTGGLLDIYSHWK